MENLVGLAMRARVRGVASVVCALVLAACGGGGGDEPATGTARFSVGGTLSGLAGAVVLRSGDRQVRLVANGPYQLDEVPAGTAYDIVVQQQPEGQTCEVRNGRGTVQAAVDNIEVRCSANLYAIGGRVEGATGALTLQQDGGAVLQLPGDGPFSVTVAHGKPWQLAVVSAPAGQTCRVEGGSGVATAPVDSVRVRCASSAVTLGGSVQGLVGSLVLRLGGETLTVTADGSFTFATPLPPGTAYEVSVLWQPGNQTCSLEAGRGIAGVTAEPLRVRCAPLGGGVSPPPPPPPPPPPIPSVPMNLTLSYGVKTLAFAWSASAAATTYQLHEDPDGAGPLPMAPLGSAVSASTGSFVVPGLLHTRLNARYAVQACNVSGCSAVSAAVAPDWARAIGYFKASNPQPNQFLGSVNAVALSADGRTLAVGAYGEASDGSSPANTAMPDAGAVYVFARTAAGWAQQAYLKAPVPDAADFFGKAIALSADGNTLAVGVDGDDASQTGTFTTTPAHDNGNTESGAVYVYTRTGSTWGAPAFIKAANAGSFDLFGFSVALSGDGNTLAVGAYLEDGPSQSINGPSGDGANDSGAVYVFVRSGGGWTQQAYIKAANAEANDWFGFKVALSFDGSTLAATGYSEASASAATPGDNSVVGAGAVYVFSRSGGTWSQQAYLKSTQPEAEDRFGNAIAISDDGATLAVAAQGDDSNRTGTFAATPADNNLATNSGAVYVFTRAGASWSQQAFIKASNTRAVDRFGHQLSLSGNGQLFAVGAYQEDSAATGFNGNQGDSSASNAGAVYLFSRTGSTWAQQAYLKAPNTGAGDRFGIGVRLSPDGSTLAIASEGEDSGASGVQGDQSNEGTSNAGAVYLY